MSEMILNTRTLPEPLYRRIRSDKVRVHEENGAIILTPIVDTTKQAEAIERLCGMFKSDGHAVDRFMEQKRLEKEIEG